MGTATLVNFCVLCLGLILLFRCHLWICKVLVRCLHMGVNGAGLVWWNNSYIACGMSPTLLLFDYCSTVHGWTWQCWSFTCLINILDQVLCSFSACIVLLAVGDGDLELIFVIQVWFVGSRFSQVPTWIPVWSLHADIILVFTAYNCATWLVLQQKSRRSTVKYHSLISTEIPWTISFHTNE